jgi:hypothetical protein
MPVVRCKYCNRPITRDKYGSGFWLHKKTKSVPTMYFSCSMYSRTKSKRVLGLSYAAPKTKGAN